MMEEENRLFTDTETYGIENPDAPGEPDNDRLPAAEPVPGTGRQTRLAHMQEHDAPDTTLAGDDHRHRIERVEIEETREEAEEYEGGTDDLPRVR